MLPDQIFVLGLTLVVVDRLHAMSASTAASACRCAPWPRALPSPASAASKIETVIRWTWMISGMLAATAGIFMGLTVQLRPEMGFNSFSPSSRRRSSAARAACSARCSAGWSWGLAENLSVLVIPAGYKAAVPFLMLHSRPLLPPAGPASASKQTR